MENNYAFIDVQNLYLSIKELGWRIDYKKLRKYLSDKYNVKKAILFIGFMPENQPLYDELQQAGYHLVYKPTVPYYNKEKGKKETKGNVDAELVLYSVAIMYQEYDKAVIVTGDGDFQCLIKYLHDNQKLKAVLIPNKSKFSSLLKYKYIKPYHRFVSDLENRIKYVQ